MRFTDDFEKREFIAREALKELKKLYPNYFKYELHFTGGKYDEYDAYYHIIDPATHSINKRVIIELKIRDTIYEEYLLETKKMNSLLKVRKNLGFNENDMTILYINFCPDMTIVWNIDDVKDNKTSNLRANKATSVDRNNKVNKSIIMLKRIEGKCLNYVLEENKILNKYKVEKIVDNKVRELKNDLFNALFNETK